MDYTVFITCEIPFYEHLIINDTTTTTNRLDQKSSHNNLPNSETNYQGDAE